MSGNHQESGVVVSPVNRLVGEMRVPGDKSISHRAAIMASLARGASIVENFSSARDCAATLRCLEGLGVRVARENSTVRIGDDESDGLLREPAQTLDAENSGTTMRLLAGVLAGQPFATTMTGDESLRSRPMSRVAEPLRLMGATVELAEGGRAPLRITGRRPLSAVRYRPPVASAQIKSAVLLAGLFADGVTVVEEPTRTRDHTERMLKEFGVQLAQNGNEISVGGGARLRARELVVPGDVSSAAFFAAAAAALPGSELLIRDVGLNPTRTAFLATLAQLGADVTVSDERLLGGEPAGTIRVRGRASGDARALTVSGTVIPNLIDELPLLAFAAAAMGCGMEVGDAAELRVKESDRIRATVENLSRMGARIEERADGWRLHGGGPSLRGASLHAFGDHRIAMSCAV
ncbi:MAG TPA: 3-phosphoshikimate 1-carboxyvinyltransferase, partial [Pyrinomonadaceae bacterium]|nr:3-phosphoshikimate 1-carboxyvinyltransferase [Pyrinomonadaceae bacterium]